MATDLGSVYAESLDLKNIVGIGSRNGIPAQFVRLAANKRLTDFTDEGKKLCIRILDRETTHSVIRF